MITKKIIFDYYYLKTHSKESSGRAGLETAILDLGLLGQVLGRLDGRLHSLHGEEGGKVGGVGGDHDEGEEPPEASDTAGGESAK